jgi:peptide methionine sulfoxide reductase MsrA
MDESIIGFSVSFNANETEKERILSYFWGKTGLNSKLADLNWKDYGQGFQLILFQIYVKPFNSTKKALKDIGKFNKKEQSIRISIVLEEENFFKLSETYRQEFLTEIIIKRLSLLQTVAKRNTLNFNISKLIENVKERLNDG